MKLDVPFGGSATASADPPNGTPVFTSLLTENLTRKGLPAGTLPGAWTAAYGAGANTVPWVMTKGFCGNYSTLRFTKMNSIGLLLGRT